MGAHLKSVPIDATKKTDKKTWLYGGFYCFHGPKVFPDGGQLPVKQRGADVSFSSIANNKNNAFSRILKTCLKGGMKVGTRGDAAKDGT